MLNALSRRSDFINKFNINTQVFIESLRDFNENV